MSFLSSGTFLHKENHIKFQIYEEEYYESTVQSVIESRIAEGTIYVDFGLERSVIEMTSRQLVEQSTIRIIAIDTALTTPRVIGQILAEDMKSFMASQSCKIGIANLDLLKQINQKLLSPIQNIPFERNEIVIGSGYGVSKEYQNMKIGNILSQLFLSVCLESPYKVFCGLFYSQKASSIMCKNGGFIMCQLKQKNCQEFDEHISDYMKHHIEIVAYVDSTKDSLHFQKLKQLVKEDMPFEIE